MEARKKWSKTDSERIVIPINIPKLGGDITNDGNTVEKLFVNPTLSSVITGIHEDLIKMFGVILKIIANAYVIIIQALGQYALGIAKVNNSGIICEQVSITTANTRQTDCWIFISVNR